MASITKDAHQPSKSPLWIACYNGIGTDGKVRRLKRSTKTTDRKLAQKLADEWSNSKNWQASRVAVEVRHEGPQLRRNTVVRFVRALRHSAVIDGCRCRSLVFFSCQHFHSSKDFIRRGHPIYRDWVAMLRGTAKSQGTVTPCTARHLNLVASNNLPANQTVTFVVQRMPLPKLIQPPQNIEFLRIRKANRGGYYSFHVHISFHNSSPDFSG